MEHVQSFSLFTEFDISLFSSGKHYRLYEKLGAHLLEVKGTKGVYFAVWAPSAKAVSVIGDFNHWQDEKHPLNVRWDGSGIWEGFIPGVQKGSLYKYKIHSHHGGQVVEKADPFALRAEHPPKTASVVWDLQHAWKDQDWIQKRPKIQQLDQPFSVYEVHLSSWRRGPGNKVLSYLELAETLTDYVKKMQFTHVELMPVMEYPFDPSWGYQITGYFAPTARFGKPEDFMVLIDTLHANGIGVILDWVPSHFPEDAHGLGNFDGSHLYEHPDRRKGYHPDWKSLIFNYGRNEVRAFLISNALFWLDKYHVDGLRVDAVASMLYLDYSREEGEWEPNIHGGRENLDAISFLKELNEAVYAHYEGVQTIAEESTSFPMVSKPTSMGGLGFGMKWMMGWMHDTLEYFKKEPIYRKHHQNDLTFSLTYAFTENFMLPLSHDEVVYGKRSLLYRMPGDEWQRFANLRLLYSFMFTQPGTKLLFMGAELGQGEEWDFQNGLDWYLLEYPFHSGIQQLVSDLNHFYRSNDALHALQFSSEGYEWIDYGDAENSVITYVRKGNTTKQLLVVCNLTPIPRKGYRIGVPKEGTYSMVFNSDADMYGGSGYTVKKRVKSGTTSWNYRPQSIEIDLPPLAMIAYTLPR
ncbi:1,4-alpha-glucan branching protein GlgB [Altibacter sp. HG106]|uniref:1,4-alpha-glucan branching protein GlgB n=1 Tax=Altibacter sp. HG106 TaxID=3023937 RepID=UPI00234FC175|nr:1,4-alpha-glucan branching protein GlgB [Altibacter sp. HG106]MDC7995407.1 1,4-alpha-glucan branching protein GlgB [Altibacter sp. HG106]